jgi:hypothetical protein
MEGSCVAVSETAWLSRWLGGFGLGRRLTICAHRPCEAKRSDSSLASQWKWRTSLGTWLIETASGLKLQPRETLEEFEAYAQRYHGIKLRNVGISGFHYNSINLYEHRSWILLSFNRSF